MNNHPAVTATQRWLENFIIPYNVCPFARRKFLANRIRYQLMPGQNPEQHLQRLMSECHYLDQHAETETTLLIFTDDLLDFAQFLDLTAIAETLLQQQGYEGAYQLASFHPDYCFADSDRHDPANFTNRSPYPMLHIIREASIETALRHYPHDPASIPERNIQRLRKMGNNHLQSILKNCSPK